MVYIFPLTQPFHHFSRSPLFSVLIGAESMMQTSEQVENLMETLLRDLITLTNRVGQAVEQATSFKVHCAEMGKQVSRLSQMLHTLFSFTTQNPTSLTYSNPICYVITKTKVSNILQEALTLACSCKRKTIFCGLLTSTKTTLFRKLYHLLENSIANMNWLLILYNPKFESAFNEIFFSIPQILCNDSSLLSAWSCMATETMIWKLAAELTSETVPLELTTSCVEALSMLKIRSALNSRMLKEIEGLMVSLAKLVEVTHGEVQHNCLMIIVEITSAVENDLDLRCKAFKTNSPGAKAIVQQVLRVIKETEDPSLQVLAVRSIGSLARIFCERKSHYAISVLVLQIRNRHRGVATEAVTALKKFACPGNYLSKAHSKRMIEFNAVQPLVKLLRDREETEQLEGLVLICYLAVNVDYSEAMEEARVVTLIKELSGKRGGLSTSTSTSRSRTVASQHPELKKLVPEALRSLNLYYKY